MFARKCGQSPCCFFSRRVREYRHIVMTSADSRAFRQHPRLHRSGPTLTPFAPPRTRKKRGIGSRGRFTAGISEREMLENETFSHNPNALFSGKS
ncbi:hypothetical protein RRSWK_01492 [Rhodopirellula sp. SWK7]|nr:hypothetical protein RRSWK_01492 [Rhodopirellula sp. SWK7]